MSAAPTGSGLVAEGADSSARPPAASRRPVRGESGGTLTAHDAVAEHGELHGSEKDECAHRGANAQVSKGEGGGVGEEGDGREDAAAPHGGERSGLGRDENREYNGARREPDQGEGGRVDFVGAECETGEQGVGREGHKCEQRECDGLEIKGHPRLPL